MAPLLAEAIVVSDDLSAGLVRAVASEDGKAVRSLFGRLSKPVRGMPEAIARRFVEGHARLFNLRLERGGARLDTVKVVEDAASSHVFFKVALQEVPVEGSDISIHMNRAGEVVLANGSVPDTSEPANRLVLGEREAIAAARRHLGVRDVRGRPTAARLICCRGDETLQAWEVGIPAAEPLGDWVVLIDAETGRELDRRNQMFFFSGQGLAYPHHPLAGDLERVELPYLMRNDLAGDYCYAVNAQGPEATSSTAVYEFAPEDTHFDEVNAYHHVTRAHDFFSGMGFNKLDFSLWTTVHFRTKFDNAFYSPKERKMYFGDGDRFNDFAKEEAIIYHEYSHGMLNEIVELYYRKEAGAMHEGQADYFACSLSGEPRIGEWISSKTELKEIRDLRDTRHYPEDIIGEVHHDGRIWGCALWDLRAVLGPEITNRLVYASFSYLNPGEPTFAEGVNAILAADTAQFAGEHRAVITDVFAKRGIMSGSAAAVILDGRDLERLRRFRAIHEKP